MKELQCRDIGFDCDAILRADTEDEIMLQATEHARDVHGMSEIDDETATQIREQIQDVPAEPV